MKFTKMEGLGNDYVYVDCTKENLNNPKEIAIKVSDRHFGIGSDGLILIKPSNMADFQMEMYNADGSQGEMCGNGIRCVGKFVHDKGLTNKTVVTVETLAGIKTLELNLINNIVETVRVNMGAPILKPELIPINADGDNFINLPITVNNKEYKVTGISMGNPHIVTYVENISELNLEEIGPYFENHELFPNRINTEFVEIVNNTFCKMRVWERGSGETFACGTGTCAVVVSNVLNGLTSNKTEVELLGGNLFIEWDQENNLVYMTGPAKFVFDGEINL